MTGPVVIAPARAVALVPALPCRGPRANL